MTRHVGQNTDDIPAYAELAVTTNYSFLRGASHADELVLAAKALGLGAVGVADRNSLAGVVRAHVAAKEAGLRLLVGARLAPEDGPELLCYPRDRAAYGRLCRLLTLGKRRAEKGDCRFTLAEVLARVEGQELIVLPPEAPEALHGTAFAAELARIARAAESVADSGEDSACHLAASLLYRGDDLRRLAVLAALAEASGAPLVAINDVRMHAAARKPLLDVLTCIREHCTIDEAGFRLEANAERHLKAPAEMARLFRDLPEAVARSMAIVERCRFSLDELRYEYPEEVEEGGDPRALLARLTWEGAAERYPGGVPPTVKAALSHELELIAELDYEPYFLTVHDIVRFARSQGILCQGRGSAANSAVCYCLGITAVDPVRLDLLFERFLSEERAGMPDIDLDIEHERREEVIQYVYQKYGRSSAAMVDEVICYRGRSSVRDVGKALGLDLEDIGQLTKELGHDGAGALERAETVSAASPRVKLLAELARQLEGLPRHTGIHVGGMVISQGPLVESVPIEPAAMPGRTVIQWDKDDCERQGLVKIDLLGLGMLTMLRKALDLIRSHRGTELDLGALPTDDPAVYDRICAADTVGVFQIESRAQMNTLPRLRPRCFYDLVVEVALIRPGPIQGEMVHPYLRRRDGDEPVTYPHPSLRPILERTLGVPLFQEQGMKLAIVAAGFTPGQADRLRRAMGFRRATVEMEELERELAAGMERNGFGEDQRRQVLAQVTAFANYGFPESHAASFALLVYASAYIKHYYPAEFACALLNSQPMGFYAPATIVHDAKRHGVEVRPIDVLRSRWDCTLEDAADAATTPALRVGLRYVRGLGVSHRERLDELLASRAFASLEAFVNESGLEPAVLDRLAAVGAFAGFGLTRRQAQWQVKRLARPLSGSLGYTRPDEPDVALAEMTVREEVAHDYGVSGLSPRLQPMALLRPELDRKGVLTAAALSQVRPGARVRTAGVVIVRQHPQTAKGFTFLTLEDETGFINLILRPKLYESLRTVVHTARVMLATGRVQREKSVVNVHCESLRALDPDRAAAVTSRSRDFC